MLSILAGENKVLEELAVNSDKALKPFAAVREHVAKFIAESNKTAEAGANTRASLARNLELFPKFLEELVPAVERLGQVRRSDHADDGRPRPGGARHQQDLHEHPRRSRPARKSSSKTSAQTAKLSGPALVATKPLLARLKKLGNAALPASTNLESLFGGFRNTGGLERLLDFIFLGTGAANGYDSLGPLPAHRRARQRSADRIPDRAHQLLRPQAVLDRAPSAASPTTAAAARRRSAASVSAGIDPATQGVVMARTLAVIKGDTPEQAIAEYPGEEEGIEVLRPRPSAARRRDRGAERRLEGGRRRLDHAEGRRRGLREGSPGGEAAAQLPARR